MNEMNESKKKKKKQNCVAASQLSWNNFLGEKLIINSLDFSGTHCVPMYRYKSSSF